jgi:DNA-binding beta-propeller fold protein YncE
MTDSKECKIIDTIDVTEPKGIIQTPCGKFLIGIEKNLIYRYNLETKQKFRIAGSVEQSGHQDGTRDESRFYLPFGLALSKYLKTLFVADKYNHVIRAICVQTGITTTFAGQVGKHKRVDGPKEKACFYYPTTLKLSPDSNMLYVAEYCKLRTICIATGQVNTIVTFENEIGSFTLCPDGKHVFICYWEQVLKYNLETGKSEIVFEDSFNDFVECDISKDGQMLFISNVTDKYIKVVNLVTNQVIDTINTLFEPSELNISTNGKQLYIVVYDNDKIKVLDISKYCTNFKTFLQSQLSKHSFLSQAVVKRISI